MRGGSAARRPALLGAGRHGAAATPPPHAAYGKAVCGAPCKCAKTLLVGTAAFVEVGEAAGKLKAAVLVRKRRAVQKCPPPEGACQPLRGFLAPSSAGAAAFSIPVFPESSAETPHLSHSCKSATCKTAHPPELPPLTRRAAPPF